VWSLKILLIQIIHPQWRRLHGARGACAPHFYKWLCTGGGTVSRRTVNKKLTKLYWPSQKRSPKRLIVLLESKMEGHDQKKFPGTSRQIGAPTFAPDRCPTFKFVPVPLFIPLSATFIWTRRFNELTHCYRLPSLFVVSLWAQTSPFQKI